MTVENSLSDIAPLPRLEKGVYRHYKNKQYEVLGLARNSETHEVMVVYKPKYESDVEFWVRPYAMFTETIVVGGKTMPRFKKISD